MQYACRAIIVSALLIWLEFKETLWEPSIPRGDVHIVTLFWSDTIIRVMALDYAVCIKSNNCFRATSATTGWN
jgi:hypothetical protein